MLRTDDGDRRRVGIDPLVVGQVAHELGNAVAVGLLGPGRQAEIAEEDLQRGGYRQRAAARPFPAVFRLHDHSFVQCVDLEDQVHPPRSATRAMRAESVKQGTSVRTIYVPTAGASSVASGVRAIQDARVPLD